MLRQIKRWLQNGPITKNGVLPVTALVYFSLEPFIRSWFIVPAALMPIFLLFVSAGVSFDGAFTMWISLKVH